jgi:Ni2+-binding GTPase involved in maturation of urease and hydrogenase
MPDLLIRNVPADLIETYESKAKESGADLERFVIDVLEGKQKPPASVPAANNAALLALTQRNLARFAQPLRPMERHEMREGLEE